MNTTQSLLDQKRLLVQTAVAKLERHAFHNRLGTARNPNSRCRNSLAGAQREPVLLPSRAGVSRVATVLCFAALCQAGLVSPAVAQQEPGGETEEVTTSSKLILQGKVEKKSGRSSTKLHTGVDASDPDAENKQVAIEWDHWRNRFAHEIWKRTNVMLVGGDAFMIGKIYIKYGVNPAREFPKGVSVDVACNITADRHVTDIHVTSSSGVKEFNELVMQAFKDLDKKHILAFPKCSQRQSVSMTVSMKIGNGQFTPFKFDDVERVTFSPPTR